MYGGLGVLTFSAHGSWEGYERVKRDLNWLDRFLLDQVRQKADLFQQRKLLCLLRIDILGGIAVCGILSVNCGGNTEPAGGEVEIAGSDTVLNLFVRRLFLLGKQILRYHIRRRQNSFGNRTKDDETGTYQFRDGTWG